MGGAETALGALADLLEVRAASGKRVIVALAGAPGSGKSTLADKLVGKLNGRQPGLAAVLLSTYTSTMNDTIIAM